MYDCVYIYIYIYYRERDVCVYIYIYMYIGLRWSHFVSPDCFPTLLFV